ncbi:DUF4230 domain-containing protein [Sphingomonas sinipercae]|uniref:DUF4230 domain-containing protein n=1 Tax=Sphingomonas sinipercae TaxID=2714944 RepID=A0A6G7ZN60_9SPHN|nr:DUF4230 domain-containing protein [Sphingomonas sinipercae]QIL02365.1 DUF4230 domain-containing protein [Sphingomonas sinipercae]
MRPIIGAGTVIIIIIGILLTIFFADRAERRREREELAQAQGVARVISATFSRQNALKVGEVSGMFDVTTVDPGALSILRSSQKVKLPYSIDYSVNLAGLDADDYRWDAERKTLLVEAPPVTVGRPNIDESRRQTLATSGLFVTRGAADNLSRRAAGLANQAAVKEANKPEHLAKARDNARQAIAATLQTPLEVAGLGDVKVVVRFPTDGYRDKERWDVSPSMAEVLANGPR